MIECTENKDKAYIVAVLLFRRKELFYDIANMAFVEGHVMVEVDDEVRHTLQDIVEEGNRDRVERILDKAHAVITEALYPYTMRQVCLDHLDNRRQYRPVFGIRLVIPKDFSQTTLNLMERLVHEYLVCDVLQDWLSITNPSKAEIWMMKRDEAHAALRRCVNNRRGPDRSRIKPHLFF